jgi:hypothetical protein
LAYGLGVDSTAIIVGLVQRGIRPDFILFADVGAEKESTYAYLPIIQQFLKDNHFPQVTVVRYQPRFAPYTTLEGNMVMNATLPGATFNRGSCTDKFKIKPQMKWEKENHPGGMIKKMIGFEAGEEYRKLRANDKAHTQKSDRYEYWYPLIDWGWTREECKARIAEAGLPVPPKSACIFCPNMQPAELLDLTEEERGRVVRVEVVAEPYNQKVHGLWRQPRKTRCLPGSMTEYMVDNGIPFTHPDQLEWMPLNENCLKGKRGFTFNGPHNELRLANLIGGCECSKAENHFHKELIEDLTLFETTQFTF